MVGTIAICKLRVFTTEIDAQPDELRSHSTIAINVYTSGVSDQDAIFPAPMVVWSSSVFVVSIPIKVLLVDGVSCYLDLHKAI